MSNAVTRLVGADYEEIVGLLCPYCAARLPDSFKDGGFRHHIPGTPDRFACQASAFRTKRYDPSDDASTEQQCQTTS